MSSTNNTRTAGEHAPADVNIELAAHVTGVRMDRQIIEEHVADISERTAQVARILNEAPADAWIVMKWTKTGPKASGTESEEQLVDYQEKAYILNYELAGYHGSTAIQGSRMEADENGNFAYRVRRGLLNAVSPGIYGGELVFEVSTISPRVVLKLDYFDFQIESE